MTILFLCPALQPGCDGVGDYTRRLAGECALHGHRCTIIGLHDSFVDRVIEEKGAVDTLRLPAAMPWADRIARTEIYAESLSPDWVSWQFVAYGFAPRGIVPSKLIELAGNLRTSRRHIMLHELWLGLESNSGTWARLNGSLQRRAVLRFLGRLLPDLVQTSNRSYHTALITRGFPATVLALFGNVPIAVSKPPPEPRLLGWLCGGSATRCSSIVAITFGTLHPQWQPGRMVEWLLQTASAHEKRPTLIIAGRAGRNASAIATAFTQRGVQVTFVGEQDATTISLLLQNSDLGIAAHPWALIGKSGAVAAMLEHGLPVVVPRDDWQLSGDSPVPASSDDPLLARLAELDAQSTRRWLAARRPPASSLPRVAEAFLEYLTQPVLIA